MSIYNFPRTGQVGSSISYDEEMQTYRAHQCEFETINTEVWILDPRKVVTMGRPAGISTRRQVPSQ